jgi:predicted DNA-binding transcriptional regulator AlpA
MNQNELLTPDQVAEILKVTVGTLENWRFKGYGPKYLKLGSTRRSPVRYRRKDVDGWVASVSGEAV